MFFCGLSLYPRIENEMVKIYEAETDQITAQTQILRAMMESGPSEDVIQAYINANQQSRQLRSAANRGAVIVLLFSVAVGMAILAFKIVNGFLSGRIQQVTAERNAVLEQVQQLENSPLTPRYTKRFEKQTGGQRVRPV
jgi:hypothetical protein